MQQLFSQISKIYTLDAAAIAALQQCLVKKEFYKNDFLLSEAKICKELYFLEQGALRGFYNVDGKEITHWFGFESDFVTSFHSFITGEPSVENIQMLEYSICWSIDKETLEKLYDSYPGIERLVRIAYEKYYIRLEERYVNSQFKTATQLYQELLSSNPNIINRVSLGHIASYLGISQETLSRIRSKH